MNKSVKSILIIYFNYTILALFNYLKKSENEQKFKCCNNNNDDKNIVLIKLIHTRVCDSVIAGEISRSAVCWGGKVFLFHV